MDAPSAPRGKSLAVTIGELVLAGLWEPTDTGWVAHDFLDWNPSKAEVLASRKEDLARKRGRSGFRQDSDWNPDGVRSF